MFTVIKSEKWTAHDVNGHVTMTYLSGEAVHRCGEVIVASRLLVFTLEICMSYKIKKFQSLQRGGLSPGILKHSFVFARGRITSNHHGLSIVASIAPSVLV